MRVKNKLRILGLTLLCSMSMMTTVVMAEEMSYENDEDVVIHETDEDEFIHETDGDIITPDEALDLTLNRLEDGVKLATPTNLRIILITDTLGAGWPSGEKLLWDLVDGANEYEVCILQDGNIIMKWNTKWGDTVLNYTEHDMEQLEKGTYTISVQALSATDASLNSDCALMEFQYEKPDNKLAVPTIKWDENDLGKITWDKVDGAAGYRIKIKCNGEIVAQADAPYNGAFGYVIIDEGKYTAEVQAVSGDINAFSSSDTGISETLNYTFPSQKLPVPANVHMDGDTLCWDAVENAGYYEITLYFDGEEIFKTITNNTDTSIEYYINKFGNGTYVYKIRAVADDIMQYAVSDYAFSPEYVIGAAPVEPDSETKPETEADGDYIVDITGNDTEIKKEDFEKIINENALRDVIFKSNVEITIRFAKGTMKEVDGKVSYDMGAEMTRDFDKLDGKVQKIIDKKNLVSYVSYHYSGELPSEAEIQINVGIEWTGKTLYYYYYDVKKGILELIQEAVVNPEGIMTVRQNHCSDYVILSEKTADAVSENETQQESTKEAEDEQDEQEDEQQAIHSADSAVNTKDAAPTAWLFLLSVISGTVLIAFAAGDKKRRYQ